MNLATPFCEIIGEFNYESFGYAVAYGGNIFGDNDPEILVSSPYHHYNDGTLHYYAGRVDIITIHSNGEYEYYPYNTNPVKIEGTEAYQYLGWTLDGIGDFNDDGYDDFALASPLYNAGGVTRSGKVEVYLGDSDPANIGTPWITKEGTRQYEQLGLGIDGRMDIDSDGYTDLVFGGDNYNKQFISDVFLYYGSEGDINGDYDLTPTIMSGEHNGDRFGLSVSTAGDINNDEYDDVVIGSAALDGEGYRVGAAKVFYGSQGGLDTDDYDTINGQYDWDKFGTSVVGGQDINNDGYDDIAVSAPSSDVIDSEFGKVYVYFGSNSGIDITESAVYFGDDKFTEYGCKVELMDTDMDGYSNVLVGSYKWNSYRGRIQVYSTDFGGLSETPLHTFEGTSSDQLEKGFGVDDYNNDGYDDYIIANYKNGNGVVDLYYGNNLETIDHIQTITGSSAGSYFGYMADSADINNDGGIDIAVSEPRYNNGRVRVHLNGDVSWFSNNIDGGANDLEFGTDLVFGQFNYDGYGTPYADLAVSSLGDAVNLGMVYIYMGAATPDFVADLPTIQEENLGDGFGKSIAVGDLNNDNYDDLVVGAPDYDNGNGKVYIYLGSINGLVGTPSETLTGSNGEGFGYSVSVVGDINSDGFEDLAIGSPFENGNPSQGELNVFMGASTNILGGSDWTYIGVNDEESIGRIISSGGDLNFDGFSDFLIGSPEFYSDEATSPEGRVIIAYGSATGISQTESLANNIPNSKYGSFCEILGDFNSDGYDDVFIGAPGEDGGEVEMYANSYPMDPAITVGVDEIPVWDHGGKFNGMDTITGPDLVNALNDLIPDEGIEKVTIPIRISSSSPAKYYIDNLMIQYIEYMSEGIIANKIETCKWGILVDNSILSVYANELTDCDNAIKYKNSDIDTTSIAVNRFENNKEQTKLRTDPTAESSVRVPYNAKVADFSMDINSEGTPESILRTSDIDDFFGYSLDSSGDFNADGYDDLLVGSPDFPHNGFGSIQLFLGSGDGMTSMSDSLEYTGTSDIGLGALVRYVGDLNDDDYDDIAVYVPNNDDPKVYVWYGKDQDIFGTGHDPVILTPPTVGLDFGINIANVGDVTGDGYDDIAIGAPGDSSNGEVYIYYGSSSGVLNTNYYSLSGTDPSFGTSVTGIGDISLDGANEIAVGIPEYGSSQGAVEIYCGSDDPTKLITPNQLILGDPEAFDGFGYSVIGIGDVTGDLYPDLLVGSPEFDNENGKVEVYKGQIDGILDYTPEYVLFGENGLRFGEKLTSIDMNSDGYNDLGISDINGRIQFYLNSENGFVEKPDKIFDEHQIVLDGLSGYWKMDETGWSDAANEVTDSSGQNNHGTPYGAVSTVTGKFSKAGSFDGNNDWIYIDGSDASLKPNELTLEAWIKPHSADNGDVILCKMRNSGGSPYYSYALLLNADGSIDFTLGFGSSETTLNSGQIVEFDEWNHIAATYDGEYMRIFFNGELLQTSAPTPGTINYNDQTVSIGDWPMGSQYYQGLIDEVRIYDRALSENELEQNYMAEPGPLHDPGINEDRVVYYPFDETSWSGSPGDVEDLSGNDNNGNSGGDADTSTGKFGRAGSFDGNGDYVNIPGFEGLAGKEEATISFWANQGSLEQTNYIVWSENNVLIEFGSSVETPGAANLRVEWSLGGVGFSNNHIVENVLDQDIWHYWTVTFNKGETRIYKDGELIYSETDIYNAIRNSPSDLYIGERSGYGGFEGLIDDFQIYNRALAAKEVRYNYGISREDKANTIMQNPIRDEAVFEDRLCYWKMDETSWSGASGEVIDSSGNAYHATAQGGASTNANGWYDRCGELDGIDDYISTSTDLGSLALGNTATLTAWIKTTQVGTDNFWEAPGIAGIEASGQDNDIFWGWIDASGKINIHADGYAGIAKSTNPINDDVWHHVAMTRDSVSGRVEMYVDGEFNAAGITGFSGQVPHSFYSIGRIEDTGGTPEYYQGLLDDVTIYDRILGPSEIRSNYLYSGPNSQRDFDIPPMWGDMDDNGYQDITLGNGDSQEEIWTMPENGLIGFWELDEPYWDGSDGQVKDSSENTIDGTAYGGVTTSYPGMFGRAGDFDGSNDYVDLGDESALDVSDAITVQAWFNYDSLPGHIVNRGGGWDESGYSLYLYSGNIRVELQNATAKSVVDNTVPGQGEWHHVAFTWEGSTKKILVYVDGLQALNSGTFTAPIGTPIQNLNLGRNELHGDYFDGQIDSVSIHNRVLTPSEIYESYLHTKKETGKINHFNNGVDNILTEHITDLDGESGSGFGKAIVSGFDFNGDGFDDVAVGAPEKGENSAGSVEIFSGSSSGIMNTALIELVGEGMDSFFGYSMDGVPDLDGDGCDELLIGSYGYEHDTGVVYLFYGSDEAMDEYELFEGTNPYGKFGFSVAYCGDVGGDVDKDFIIGEPGSNNAYVIGKSGGTYTILHTLTDGESDSFGWCVDGDIDFTGDGIADILVTDPDDNYGEGALFVYDDPSSGPLYTLTSGEEGAHLGLHAEFFNGFADEADVICLNSPDIDNGYYADVGAVIYITDSDLSPGTNSISSLSEENIIYGKEEEDHFGTSFGRMETEAFSSNLVILDDMDRMFVYSTSLEKLYDTPFLNNPAVFSGSDGLTCIGNPESDIVYMLQNGYGLDVAVDVGADGTTEKTISGTLDSKITLTDQEFIDSLNQLIPESGTGFADIPFEVSSNVDTNILLSNLMIDIEFVPKITDNLITDSTNGIVLDNVEVELRENEISGCTKALEILDTGGSVTTWLSDQLYHDNGYGIYTTGANQLELVDCLLYSNTYSMYIDDSDVSVLDSKFNKAMAEVYDSGSLTVKWTDSLDIDYDELYESATVEVYSALNIVTPVYSRLIDSDILISDLVLTEYIQTNVGGSQSFDYYSPYQVKVTEGEVFKGIIKLLTKTSKGGFEQIESSGDPLNDFIFTSDSSKTVSFKIGTDSDEDLIPDSVEVNDNVFIYHAEDHGLFDDQLMFDDPNAFDESSIKNREGSQIIIDDVFAIEPSGATPGSTYKLYFRAKKTSDTETEDIYTSTHISRGATIYIDNEEHYLSTDFRWYSTKEFTLIDGNNVRVEITDPSLGSIRMDKLMLVRMSQGASVTSYPGQLTDWLEKDSDLDYLGDNIERRGTSMWFEAEDCRDDGSVTYDEKRDVIASNSKAMTNSNQAKIFDKKITLDSGFYDVYVKARAGLEVTELDSGVTNGHLDFNDITWYGTNALLVGEEGLVVKMDTSHVFTTVTTSTTNDLNEAVYNTNDGEWHIVGQDDTIVYYDGVSATVLDAGESEDFRSVTVNPLDGRTWVSGARDIYELYYDGTYHCDVLSFGGDTITSDINGILWSPNVCTAICDNGEVFEITTPDAGSSYVVNDMLVSVFTEDLYSQVNSGGDSRIIVGANGQMGSYSYSIPGFGSTSLTDSGRTNDLYDISIMGMAAYMPMSDGKLLKYEGGSAFTEYSSPTLPDELSASDVYNSRVYFVGEDLSVLYIETAAATEISIGDADLKSTAWTNNGEYGFLVGAEGSVYRYDPVGEIFKDVSHDNTAYSFKDVIINQDDTEAIIVGDEIIFTLDLEEAGEEPFVVGDAYTVIDDTSGNYYKSITYDSRSERYLIAASGTGVISFDGIDQFETFNCPINNVEFTSIEFNANNNISVITATGGSFFTFENGIFNQYDSTDTGTQYTLNDIAWKFDTDQAFIIGDQGVVLLFDPQLDSISDISDPSTTNDLFGIEFQDLFYYAIISGSEGLLQKYDYEYVTYDSITTTNTLYNVKWNPQLDFALIVGNGGAVIKTGTPQLRTEVRETSGGTTVIADDSEFDLWTPNQFYNVHKIPIDVQGIGTEIEIFSREVVDLPEGNLVDVIGIVRTDELEIDTFSDDSTQQQLTFTPGESALTYLEIPSNAVVTQANMEVNIPIVNTFIDNGISITSPSIYEDNLVWIRVSGDPEVYEVMLREISSGNDHVLYSTSNVISFAKIHGTNVVIQETFGGCENVLVIMLDPDNDLVLDFPPDPPSEIFSSDTDDHISPDIYEDTIIFLSGTSGSYSIKQVNVNNPDLNAVSDIKDAANVRNPHLYYNYILWEEYVGGIWEIKGFSRGGDIPLEGAESTVDHFDMRFNGRDLVWNEEPTSPSDDIIYLYDMVTGEKITVQSGTTHYPAVYDVYQNYVAFESSNFMTSEYSLKVRNIEDGSTITLRNFGTSPTETYIDAKGYGNKLAWTTQQVSVANQNLYLNYQSFSLDVGDDGSIEMQDGRPLRNIDHIDSYDLSDAINEYLDQHRDEGSTVLVPIRFSSDQVGTVNIRNPIVKLGTPSDPCSADTDSDGIEDGFESLGYYGRDIIEAEDAVEFKEIESRGYAWTESRDVLREEIRAKIGQVMYKTYANLIAQYNYYDSSYSKFDNSFLKFKYSVPEEPIANSEATSKYRLVLNPEHENLREMENENKLSRPNGISSGYISLSGGMAQGTEGEEYAGSNYQMKIPLDSSNHNEKDLELTEDEYNYLIDVINEVFHIKVILNGQEIEGKNVEITPIIEVAAYGTTPFTGITNGNLNLIVTVAYSGDYQFIPGGVYEIEMGVDMRTMSTVQEPAGGLSWEYISEIIVYNIDRMRIESKGLNPLFSDTDGDWILDSGEIDKNKYPINPDCDGDGLNDYVETEITLTDMRYRDSDYDGVRDGVELGYSQEEIVAMGGESSSMGSWWERIAHNGNMFDFTLVNNYDIETTYSMGVQTWWDGIVHVTDPFDSDTDDDGLPDGWADGWFYQSPSANNPLAKSYSIDQVKYEDINYWKYDVHNWGYGPYSTPDNLVQIYEGEDINCDGGRFSSGSAPEFGFDPLTYQPTYSNVAGVELDENDLSSYLETAPDNADTDGDEMPDGWEIIYSIEESVKLDGEYLLNPMDPTDKYENAEVALSDIVWNEAEGNSQYSYLVGDDSQLIGPNSYAQPILITQSYAGNDVFNWKSDQEMIEQYEAIEAIDVELQVSEEMLVTMEIWINDISKYNGKSQPDYLPWGLNYIGPNPNPDYGYPDSAYPYTNEIYDCYRPEFKIYEQTIYAKPAGGPALYRFDEIDKALDTMIGTIVPEQGGLENTRMLQILRPYIVIRNSLDNPQGATLIWNSNNEQEYPPQLQGATSFKGEYYFSPSYMSAYSEYNENTETSDVWNQIVTGSWPSLNTEYFKYKLVGLDVSSDDLTNWEEFQVGTDPKVMNTDRITVGSGDGGEYVQPNGDDGLNDGMEVKRASDLPTDPGTFTDVVNPGETISFTFDPYQTYIDNYDAMEIGILISDNTPDENGYDVSGTVTINTVDYETSGQMTEYGLYLSWAELPIGFADISISATGFNILKNSYKVQYYDSGVIFRTNVEGGALHYENYFDHFSDGVPDTSRYVIYDGDGTNPSAGDMPALKYDLNSIGSSDGRDFKSEENVHILDLGDGSEVYLSEPEEGGLLNGHIYFKYMYIVKYHYTCIELILNESFTGTGTELFGISPENMDESIYLSNPFSADTDHDGMHDGEEGYTNYRYDETMGSTPFEDARDYRMCVRDPDSDNDGLIDGEEKNPVNDIDTDGFVNVLDPDSDNDGLIDGEETFWYEDTDSDGLINMEDTDSDDDGILDLAETNPLLVSDGSSSGRTLLDSISEMDIIATDESGNVYFLGMIDASNWGIFRLPVGFRYQASNNDPENAGDVELYAYLGAQPLDFKVIGSKTYVLYSDKIISLSGTGAWDVEMATTGLSKFDVDSSGRILALKGNELITSVGSEIATIVDGLSSPIGILAGSDGSVFILEASTIRYLPSEYITDGEAGSIATNNGNLIRVVYGNDYGVPSIPAFVDMDTDTKGNLFVAASSGSQIDIYELDSEFDRVVPIHNNDMFKQLQSQTIMGVSGISMCTNGDDLFVLYDDGSETLDYYYSARTDMADLDTDGDGLADGGNINIAGTDYFGELVTGRELALYAALTSNDYTTLDNNYVSVTTTHFTNALKSDTDGDGLDDYEELFSKEVTDTDEYGSDLFASCYFNLVNVSLDSGTQGGYIQLEQSTYTTNNWWVRSDPTEADTDFDGLSDSVEYGFTNPLMVDTDQDGGSDAVEDRNSNGQWDSDETNPLDRDTDDDRLPDYGIDGWFVWHTASGYRMGFEGDGYTYPYSSGYDTDGIIQFWEGEDGDADGLIAGDWGADTEADDLETVPEETYGQVGPDGQPGIAFTDDDGDGEGSSPTCFKDGSNGNPKDGEYQYVVGTGEYVDIFRYESNYESESLMFTDDQTIRISLGMRNTDSAVDYTWSSGGSDIYNFKITDGTTSYDGVSDSTGSSGTFDVPSLGVYWIEWTSGNSGTNDISYDVSIDEDWIETGKALADGIDNDGVGGVDDNIDETDELLVVGSDDVEDPLGDNYDRYSNPDGTENDRVIQDEEIWTESDPTNPDCDGDGIADGDEIFFDLQKDGQADLLVWLYGSSWYSVLLEASGDNGDTLIDYYKTDATSGNWYLDLDGDGLPHFDVDSDNDGLRDFEENYNLDSILETETHTYFENDDGSGQTYPVDHYIEGNPYDPDSDDDLLLDGAEPEPFNDLDRDGYVNLWDQDSNDFLGNGIGQNGPDEPGFGPEYTFGGQSLNLVDTDDTDATSIYDSYDHSLVTGESDFDQTYVVFRTNAIDIDDDGKLDYGQNGDSEWITIDNSVDLDDNEGGTTTDPLNMTWDVAGYVIESEANRFSDTKQGSIINVEFSSDLKEIFTPEEYKIYYYDGGTPGETPALRADDLVYIQLDSEQFVVYKKDAGATKPSNYDNWETTSSVGPVHSISNKAPNNPSTAPNFVNAHQETYDPRPALHADADFDGIEDDIETLFEIDPNDADTDNDGIIDGDEPQWWEDFDGDGNINANDPDSDGDGILDGVEIGLTKDDLHQHTFNNTATFGPYYGADYASRTDPDADQGATVTDVLDHDSDDDGIWDGWQDGNHDLVRDDTSEKAGEDLDANGAITGDTNKDGYWNTGEDWGETNPNDIDSDEDGLSDGFEYFSGPDAYEPRDTDSDGKINALDPDSDGDKIYDSVEMGLTYGSITQATDTDRGHFIADSDPDTKSKWLIADSDGDGIIDGEEDANNNGKLDSSETNPIDADSDGDGLLDGEDVDENDAIFPYNSVDDLILSDGNYYGELSTRSLKYDFNGDVTDFEQDSTTDPLLADSDGDGLDDGYEIAGGGASPTTTQTDPSLSDSDGDTLSDKLEINGWAVQIIHGRTKELVGDESTYISNPLRKDTDGDGKRDDVEYTFSSDPTSLDTDGDGLLDSDEENSQLAIIEGEAPEVMYVKAKWTKKSGANLDCQVKVDYKIEDNSGIDYIIITLGDKSSGKILCHGSTSVVDSYTFDAEWSNALLNGYKIKIETYDENGNGGTHTAKINGALGKVKEAFEIIFASAVEMALELAVQAWQWVKENIVEKGKELFLAMIDGVKAGSEDAIEELKGLVEALTDESVSISDYIKSSTYFKALSLYVIGYDAMLAPLGYDFDDAVGWVYNEIKNQLIRIVDELVKPIANWIVKFVNKIGDEINDGIENFNVKINEYKEELSKFFAFVYALFNDYVDILSEFKEELIKIILADQPVDEKILGTIQLFLSTIMELKDLSHKAIIQMVFDFIMPLIESSDVLIALKELIIETLIIIRDSILEDIDDLFELLDNIEEEIVDGYHSVKDFILSIPDKLTNLVNELESTFQRIVDRIKIKTNEYVNNWIIDHRDDYDQWETEINNLNLFYSFFSTVWDILMLAPIGIAADTMLLASAHQDEESDEIKSLGIGFFGGLIGSQFSITSILLYEIYGVGLLGNLFELLFDLIGLLLLDIDLIIPGNRQEGG